MIGRLAVSAVPLVLLGLGAAVSPPPASKTTRYRIESKTQQEVDLTVAGGGKQTTDVSQFVILSITLTDTAGGKVMHAVIDSATVESPAPEVGATAAKARGAWIHGFVDAWGRATIAASSADSNDVVAQLKPTLTRFFPVMKPGSKQGDSWVDTSNVSVKSTSQAIKSVRVSTYTHAGTATWGGASATRIDATTSTSGAGTIENPMAGTMELETTSTGTEAMYVAADGTYLGGESKSGGDSKVRAAMLPDAIPVKSTSSSTVTVIK
jgi:hypothetical protein